MLRKLIGVLMLILLFGSMFVITACFYSVRRALLAFGATFAIVIFVTIAVKLIVE